MQESGLEQGVTASLSPSNQSPTTMRLKAPVLHRGHHLSCCRSEARRFQIVSMIMRALDDTLTK